LYRPVFVMHDELHSPIKQHLNLHQICPEQSIRHLSSFMIERDLFGIVHLVRNWGRIGTGGHGKVEIYDNEIAAGEELEAVAWAKRRSYHDL
jgi:hypothetical protein